MSINQEKFKEMLKSQGIEGDESEISCFKKYWISIEISIWQQKIFIN